LKKKKKKINRAMRWLENCFNPEASTMVRTIEKGRKMLLEQKNVALFREIVIYKEP
jgi:hypothetical protein